jgi:hypothetical protein
LTFTIIIFILVQQGTSKEEIKLLTSMNVTFCINSLETSLATIVQQQSTILQQQSTLIAEQKSHREQLESFKHEVNEQLRKIKNREDMIKARQEMIFTKQDQIQFTLHGETRPFQSPPLLSSPPVSSPFGSAMGSETFPRASLPTPSIADASDYSSVVDSNYYDSLFGLDWLTSILPEEKNAPKLPGDSGISKRSLLEQTQQHPVEGDQSVCYEQFPATPGGPEMSMLSPPPLGHQAGSGTPIHAGPSVRLSAAQSAGLFTEPSVSAGPPAGHRSSTGLSATAGQSSGYRPSAEITAGPSAGLSGSGGTSAGLCKKDPTQIIDPNVKYELKDVGKLGRALALHVYCEAVLRESTPSGNVKRNLPLDQEKLRSLVTNIHHHSSFASMNIRDFQQLVKKKIVPSIAHLCKELCSRHELKK